MPQSDRCGSSLPEPPSWIVLFRRAMTATVDATKVSRSTSSSTLTTSHISLVNSGWLVIAGKFIESYLMGQTAAFYAQYPFQASFSAPIVSSPNSSETEDCLFLNVKVLRLTMERKNLINKKTSVLVWLYGGGYTGGYKTQYSTDSLLTQSRADKSEGVILVQPNYRVRILFVIVCEKKRLLTHFVTRSIRLSIWGWVSR